MPISAGLQTRHKNAQLIKCIPDDAPICNSYISYTRSSLHVNIDLAEATLTPTSAYGLYKQFC